MRRPRLPRWLIEDPLGLPVSAIAVLYGATETLSLFTVHKTTPDSIEGLLPHWMIAAWALALAVGGLLVLSSRPREGLRGEAAGLACMIFGLAFYAGALLSFDQLAHLLSVLLYLGLAGGFGIRLAVVQMAIRASKTARRITREADDA